MAKIKFLLKDKSVYETSIRIQFYYKNKRFVYGSGKTIPVELWDSKQGMPTTDRSVLSKWSKSHHNIKQKLKNLTRHLEDYRDEIEDFIYNHEKRREAVSFDSLRSHLDKTIKGIEIIEDKGKVKVADYIRSFVKGIKEGSILQSNINSKKVGQRYSKGTVKNYENFSNLFDQYQEGKDVIYFNDIDMRFYNLFVSFCHKEIVDSKKKVVKKAFKRRTIGRHIKHLKRIIGHAYDNGVHSNPIHRNRDFAILEAEPNGVYLNANELDKLYHFNDYKIASDELYKDIFLICCLSLQRYSDCKRITPMNKIVRGENSFLRILQQKSKKTVTVPISDRLDAILSKYNYKLPKNDSQQLNRKIKKIAKSIGIDEPTEIIEEIGGVQVPTIKPKGDWLASHSGRRTGITLAYLAKIDIYKIAAMSGHSSIKDLENYIRVDNIELASELASHSFFDDLKEVV